MLVLESASVSSNNCRENSNCVSFRGLHLYLP